MNLEDAKNRTYVMVTAKEDGLADEELIELYGRISMVVLMNQRVWGYEVTGHGIGNNAFDFSIVVPQGSLMLDQLSNIFFNKIGSEFKVTCKKFELGEPGYVEDEEKYNFEVQFKPDEEFEIKKQ
ncbi:MAG TPA: hypothetical protein ENH82_18940 [bacterium]|nr:hypothetical protein [bacterium]